MTPSTPLRILAPTAAALVAAACGQGAAEVATTQPGVVPEPRPATSGAPPATEAETAPTEAPGATVTTPTVTTSAPPSRPAITTTTVALPEDDPEPSDADWWAGQPGYSEGVWPALAQCESGMTNAATGNGYWGYFQFSLSTWWSIGETGYPTDYDYAHQRAAAERLQARSGWSQWPFCARKLGLL